MNRVEFEQCVEAVMDRVEAATDGEAARVQVGDEQLTIFAGTGLPARDVITFLTEEARDKAPLVADWPGWSVLKSVSLNAFLLGFECGRRSS